MLKTKALGMRSQIKIKKDGDYKQNFILYPKSPLAQRS